MDDAKSRHTVWLSKEAWDTVKSQYRSDNCTTQNEFIEKAIFFYNGYLHAEDASRFLPRALSNVLEGTLGIFGDRMGKHLYKLSVENNLMGHILAADTDMDYQTYQQMRGYSVREVQQTNGQISFKDALLSEKEL